MAKMAKGQSQTAIELLVGTGFAVQMKQTEARLRKLHPKMMKAICEANGRHPFTTMGLDNFQQALFHSCGPTTYLIGTVRYVKEFLLPLLVQGALFLCRATGVLHYVSVVQTLLPTFFVVLKAIMPATNTALTVPMTAELPNLDWEIVDFDPLNSPAMPPVTYKNQEILTSHHLPPFDQNEGRDYLFDVPKVVTNRGLDSKYKVEQYMRDVHKTNNLRHFLNNVFLSNDDESLFGQLVCSLQPTLKAVSRFQSNLVQQFYPYHDKVSKMQILPMSGLDETRKDESTLLFPEMLNDLGTFKETENTKYEFDDEEVQTGQCRLCGADQLTNQNLTNISQWLMHQQSNLKNKQFTKRIQEAIDGTLFIPGGFHVALHMMVLIYKFCYGAFLQVFQTLINWK
jgi:hypothetical protein